MMLLNKTQFVKQVKNQELKFLVFFENERSDYSNIDGNFYTINCLKKSEFPRVLEELENFINEYEGKTFVVKACTHRHGRNYQIYKVQFFDKPQAMEAINNGNVNTELSEEVEEKLKRLESFENRNMQREQMIDLFVNMLFEKAAIHIENLFTQTLNVTPMNGEQTQPTGKEEQTAQALEKILSILGEDLIIKVAAKMEQNPIKAKTMLSMYV